MHAVRIGRYPPQAGVPRHVVQVVAGGALLLQGGFRQAGQARERGRAQVLQMAGAPACCRVATSLFTQNVGDLVHIQDGQLNPGWQTGGGEGMSLHPQNYLPVF